MSPKRQTLLEREQEREALPRYAVTVTILVRAIDEGDAYNVANSALNQGTSDNGDVIEYEISGNITPEGVSDSGDDDEDEDEDA